MQNNKKNRRNQELNQVAVGLSRYFAHLWDFIEGKNVTVEEGQKAKNREWQTNKEFKLDDITLLKRYLSPGKLVGVRFKTAHGLTKYLMLDIDITSQYHPLINPKGFNKLLTAIHNMGLEELVYVQSSDSGGLHLYIPLSKQLPVFMAACWLEMSMRTAGLDIRAGQLELFPNAKQHNKGKKWSLYNAHNLPLQPESGSALLDNQLDIISKNPLDFIREMDFCAQHKNVVTDEMLAEAQAAEAAIKKERCIFNGDGYINSKKVKEWKEDLEFYPEVGWTGNGETNDLLIKFGAYGVVFLGLDEDGVAEHIKETAMNAPGYEEHCQHKHEIEKRSREVARSVCKYYWKLGDAAKRSCTYQTMSGKTIIANGNEAKSLNSMERLQAVMEYIKEHCQGFNGTVRKFCELISSTSKQLFKEGIGTNTLYKDDAHKAVWQPVCNALMAAVVSTSIATKPAQAESINCTVEPVEATRDVIEETTPEPSKIADSGRLSPSEQNPKQKTPDPAETQGVFHLSNEVYIGEALGNNSELSQENLDQKNIRNPYPKQSAAPSRQPISKTYQSTNTLQSDKPPESEPDPDPDPLETYYQELYDRHPHLKAHEVAKESPEYQNTFKASMARIRGNLDAVRNKLKGKRGDNSSFP